MAILDKITGRAKKAAGDLATESVKEDVESTKEKAGRLLLR